MDAILPSTELIISEHLDTSGSMPPSASSIPETQAYEK